MSENNVFAYFSKMDSEKRDREKRNKGSEKRLTIVLSEYDFRRLKYIAKYFGELNSVFARNLILESLKDAEKFLELEEIDDTYFANDERIDEYSDYGKYINGLLEDEDDDNDDSENRSTSEIKKRRRDNKASTEPNTSKDDYGLLGF